MPTAPDWERLPKSCGLNGRKPKAIGKMPRARNSSINTWKNSSPAWIKLSWWSTNWTSSSTESGRIVSKLLGISQTLETLEALRSATRDFTTRAARLKEELRVRTIRAAQHQKTTIEEITSKLAAGLAEEDAKFQTAISTAKANYEKRKNRLGKAYRSSKEHGLARVEDRTGQRKYALQRQRLQAERDRDTGLANATAALEEFRKNLAGEQDALNAIEATTRASFKGY